MKHKEFNLEEVLRTGRAVTRDGREVTGIIEDSGEYIVGFVNTSGQYDRFYWHLNGTTNVYGCHEFDLFCISEEPEINIEQILEDLLGCFSQACWVESEKKYDHMCISSYECAQKTLIATGKIKPEDCYRN